MMPMKTKLIGETPMREKVTRTNIIMTTTRLVIIIPTMVCNQFNFLPRSSIYNNNLYKDNDSTDNNDEEKYKEEDGRNHIDG